MRRQSSIYSPLWCFHFVILMSILPRLAETEAAELVVGLNDLYSGAC